MLETGTFLFERRGKCNRTISRVTKITCIIFIIRSTNKITCTRDRNYFFNCVQSFIVIFTFSIVILYFIFYLLCSIFKYDIILLIVISRVPRILQSKMANFAAGFSKFCKIAQIWKLSAQSTKLGWTLSILKFNFQIKNPFIRFICITK